MAGPIVAHAMLAAEVAADPETLLARLRYFDRILNDGCFYWTVGHRVRVLLTNGGD